MKQTFEELFAYLKNPILKEDEITDFKYRFSTFLKLLVICLLTGFVISPIFVIIEELGWIDMDTHAMEELVKNMSKLKLAFFAIIAAPIIEELLFRAPLRLFKNPKSFKLAFYILTLLFGFIHISNFEITTNVLLLAPILVLPQILLGSYLGFIRLRFGLQWSIFLHAAYNGILLCLSFIPDFVS
jgi:membrane protease YdiL (CAAX protease family)